MHLGRLADSTTTATDYSPSWYDIVGTMRQVGPALAQAESNLEDALEAAMNADAAADPTGASTPNEDAFAAAGGLDTLQQLNTALSTYDSIAGALNTFSAVFPGGPITLQGLRGILPDSLSGWTLTAVLGFFGPLPALLSAAYNLYQTFTGSAAPGAGLPQTIQASVASTTAAVNNAINNLSTTPSSVAASAAAAATSIGKYAVIGLVVFLLGDALIHKT